MTTFEEYEAFTRRPENSEFIFELVDGVIVQKPMEVYYAVISTLFTTYLAQFVYGDDLRVREIGYVTGGGGGYKVSDDVLIPDGAFVSYKRFPQPPSDTFDGAIPNIAVEVVSPSESAEILNVKIAKYLAAQTVVWAVYWDEKLVRVYTPGRSVRIYGSGEILDGGDALPGFTLDLALIFKHFALID